METHHKIELDSVEDKVTVLRLKGKCEKFEKLADAAIKNCELHAERVSRFNKFLLSKIKDRNKYIITCHGLIKPKANIKQPKGTRGVGQKHGDESDHDDGEEEAAPEETGDNREACDPSPPKQSKKT